MVLLTSLQRTVPTIFIFKSVLYVGLLEYISKRFFMQLCVIMIMHYLYIIHKNSYRFLPCANVRYRRLRRTMIKSVLNRMIFLCFYYKIKEKIMTLRG